MKQLFHVPSGWPSRRSGPAAAAVQLSRTSIRWWLPGLLASCFAIAICGAAEPPPAADIATRAGEDWGSFMGPGGAGTSSCSTMAVPWPATGPRLLWSLAMGEGYCAPAVARGRIVVFDRVGNRLRLRCLEAETGRPLWEQAAPTAYADTFGYDGGPRAQPVIDGDRVVTFAADGRLECRGLADGAVLWEVDTAATYHVVQNFFGVGAAPLVVEGAGQRLVVVQVGGSPPGSIPPAPERLDRVKGCDSGLVAFDLVSGREAWRSSDQLASYSTPVAARMGDRERILSWMRNDLLVVDPATGTVAASFRWRDDELFSAVAASPVVRGDEVLLSETYGPGSVLLRMAAEGLREVRRDREGARPEQALKSHWSTPVLHEGWLYGSSGRHSGDAQLVCVDWKTGTPAWAEPGYGRATLLVVGNHLIVLGEFGDLALVQATPQKYSEVSRMRLADRVAGSGALLAPPCWAPPVVARGLLYVRGRDQLLCFDLEADASTPDASTPSVK